MITLTKLVEKLNLKWVENSGKDNEETYTASFPDLTVIVTNGLEVADVETWVKKKDVLRLQHLVRKANAHVLYHDGSDAHRALATKVAKGEEELETLKAYKYTHDWAALPKERESKEVKVAKAMASLDDAGKKKVMEMAAKFAKEAADKAAAEAKDAAAASGAEG